MSATLAGIMLALTPSVAANDSMARRGVGGIELLKTDRVRLLREVLEISPTKVRVLYRFKNESPEDLRTTVAFPMPLYEANVQPHGNSHNRMRSFTAQVDGRVMPTESLRKAMIGEDDVTDRLREIGLTEEEIFETFAGCTPENVERDCNLDPGRLPALKSLVKEDYFWPIWKVSETMFWEQVFPAGREIQVAHEYRPMAGERYDYPFASGEFDPDRIPHHREACVDQPTRIAIAKKGLSLIKDRNERRRVYLAHKDVEYILGTGRNWKGPIQDFILRVEKGSSDFVSLCFPGKPARVSTTAFEFRFKDYVPQDKVVVHFYSLE